MREERQQPCPAPCAPALHSALRDREDHGHLGDRVAQHVDEYQGGALRGWQQPERRGDVISLGFKSIVSGTLSTCLIGAIVGVLN